MSDKTKTNEGRTERRHQRVFWEKKRTASFDAYKRQGVSVFMDKEELDKETIVQMESWGKPERLELLKRGDAFRMTPAAVRESETGIAVTRRAVDLLVGIRANLRMEVHGKWTPETQRWEKETLGLKTPAFKRQKEKLPQTEEAWEKRLVGELEKGVGTWSRNKGGGGIDIVGCTDRIQGFHNEWNPLRQSTGGASKQKEKRGEKRKRVTESRPDNIGIKEHIEFGALRRDQRRWRFERAEQGGGAVLISRQRWKREARKQVEGKEAYAKATEIEKELREENLDPKGVRWFEGATGENNSIRLWRSSLDFKPLKKDIGEERREGGWTSEEGVIRSTLTRLEYWMTQAEFGPGSGRRVCKEVNGQRTDETKNRVDLPEDIIRDLVARKKKEEGENARWGLGKIDTLSRSEMKAIALEVTQKLHKTPVEQRPVGRAFASPTRPLETFVNNLLVEVIGDGERERSTEGQDRIILEDSRELVGDLETMMKRWDEEHKNPYPSLWEERVEIETWDVSALYPSLKIQYVVREIDTLLVERIDTRKGEEKKRAEALREIVIPLIIFQLQHQIVYVLSDEREEKEEKLFYWQKEGVGIGNVASGALANGTLLVGERKMLKEMKEQGHRVLLYKRYIDDILAIFEHQDGLQKRTGADMMEKLINGLDSKDGSIRVTPAKGISSMRKREKETLEESVEYLDVEIVLKGQSVMSLETGIYRKEAAADMYIQANSAHPWALKMGVVKGELIRYLTRCSTEERFEKAWERFRAALLTRGYTGGQLQKARGGLGWSDRTARFFLECCSVKNFFCLKNKKITVSWKPESLSMDLSVTNIIKKMQKLSF